MLSALFLATKLILAAKAPYVVENTKTTTGVHLVIKNPLPRIVIVTIRCAGAADYDESELSVFPRTLQAVDIETAPPADACYMSSWR